MFFFIVISLKAQSPCEKKLDDAENYFTEGNLYIIPSLLEDCLEKGFSKQEKIDALRLLTLTYLYLNKDEYAEDAFQKLLTIDPTHQVTPGIDPDQLVYLYQSFKTDPVYYIGVLLGTNYSIPEATIVQKPHAVSNINFSGASGFMAGLNFSYPLTMKWTFVAEPIFSIRSFSVDVNNIKAISLETNRLDIFNYPQSWQEDYTRIMLPLSMTYNISLGIFRPFVQIGVAPSYLVSAHLRDFFWPTDNPAEPRVFDDINIRDYSRKFDLQLLGGFGISYQNKANLLSLHVNYYHTLESTKNTFIDDRYNEILDNTAIPQTIVDINAITINFMYRRAFFDFEKIK